MKNLHPVFADALRPFLTGMPGLIEKPDAERLKRDLEAQTGEAFEVREWPCEACARFWVERSK